MRPLCGWIQLVALSKQAYSRSFMILYMSINNNIERGNVARWPSLSTPTGSSKLQTEKLFRKTTVPKQSIKIHCLLLVMWWKLEIINAFKADELFVFEKKSFIASGFVRGFYCTMHYSQCWYCVTFELYVISIGVQRLACSNLHANGD